MTQIEKAKNNLITEEMKVVASDEGVEVDLLRRKIADGKVVIPHNVKHDFKNFKGIGEGLRTKVNVNIGTSPDEDELERELEKAEIAVKAGADSIMDLSTGGDLTRIRKAILESVNLPVGTVPIYQAAIEAVRRGKSIMDMDERSILGVIREHAEDGVDFMTIHCGVTKEVIERLRKRGRVMDIVSRGGAFLIEWMVYHGRENPLYQYFDEILDMAKEYDVTLSLGDGLRPGCIADATDSPQIQELIILGELRERAWSRGIQVMIEGPGHLPLHQIRANVLLEKELCGGAPFYVLGPVVTDVAPGYDHITGAIGGAVAGMAGADFLCYVTPGEHLRLPTLEDVREGVIVTRIAAHAADLAKEIPAALDWDFKISKERRELNWDKQIALSIDPEKAKKYRGTQSTESCSMCGPYCAIKIVDKSLKRV